MLTFIICTLLVLFILSLNICEGDFLLSLQITGILALGVSLLFVIFFIHFIIISALIIFINQVVVEDPDLAWGIACVLSAVATAIYTIVGIRKLYGN
jgi:hypothetical protein